MTLSTQTLSTQTLTPHAEADAPDTLEVTDTTCVPGAPRRVHAMMIGGSVKEIEFNLGRPTAVPLDVGLRFLKTDAFLVVDPRTGRKYDPTPPVPTQESGFRLGPDETVARWDELTQDALFVRAKQLPGAEDIKKGSTPKEKLIEFLKWRAMAAPPPPKKRDDIDRIPAGDLVGGAMSDDELRALLPDAGVEG